ncbi:MAG: acetyltransferase [Paludibacteraceae bacterium]|nr:acetyltransferase [Paludibacteraceae bacterium]
MSRKVAILGGLGNATVIAAAIEHARRMNATDLEVAGFLNDREDIGTMLDMFPVIGRTSDAPKLLAKGYWFINAILRIDGNRERIAMFESLGIPDDRLASFVHPMAYVAPSVELGPGTIIMPQVAMSPGTKLGKGSIMMVGATMGHDNEVGPFCHIAAQACVGSYLHIGKGVHIGFNATIRENLTIGDNATLGMGAVLTKNIGENEIWAGNPAKFLRYAN